MIQSLCLEKLKKRLQEEMYELAEKYGLCDSQTVAKSQELDVVINQLSLRIT